MVLQGVEINVVCVVMLVVKRLVFVMTVTVMVAVLCDGNGDGRDVEGGFEGDGNYCWKSGNVCDCNYDCDCDVANGLGGGGGLLLW